MKFLINNFKNNENITIKYFNKNKIERVKVQLKPIIFPLRLVYSSFEKIDYFIISGVILMNLTYNHVYNNYSNNISILCNTLKTKNRLKSKIIVSFVIPNSKANIINNIVETNIITKINDIDVSSINELKKAIEKTLIINKKEYIKIESDNGKYLLMELKKCIEQDLLFSNIYNYPLTDFHKKYAEKYSLKSSVFI